MRGSTAPWSFALTPSQAARLHRRAFLAWHVRTSEHPFSSTAGGRLGPPVARTWCQVRGRSHRDPKRGEHRLSSPAGVLLPGRPASIEDPPPPRRHSRFAGDPAPPRPPRPPAADFRFAEDPLPAVPGLRAPTSGRTIRPAAPTERAEQGSAPDPHHPRPAPQVCHGSLQFRLTPPAATRPLPPPPRCGEPDLFSQLLGACRETARVNTPPAAGRKVLRGPNIRSQTHDDLAASL